MRFACSANRVSNCTSTVGFSSFLPLLCDSADPCHQHVEFRVAIPIDAIRSSRSRRGSIEFVTSCYSASGSKLTLVMYALVEPASAAGCRTIYARSIMGGRRSGSPWRGLRLRRRDSGGIATYA